MWLPQIWSHCEGRDRIGRVNISHSMSPALLAPHSMLSTASLFIHTGPSVWVVLLAWAWLGTVKGLIPMGEDAEQ